MQKLLFIICFFFTFLGVNAQEQISHTDSLTIKKNKKSPIIKFIENFSEIDTSYIEPQKYNYTFMLQNTNSFEAYRLSSKNQTLLLSPSPAVRIGPYLGWRWLFLGYTFDISHLRTNSTKQEFNLSLYSSQIGIDLFYKKTGNDYKIQRLNLGKEIDNNLLTNLKFEGFKATTKGFNFYYIFNHHKFSYPAAFSQSTIQRRSTGSALLGIGFSKHTISLDWNELESLVQSKIPKKQVQLIDERLKFSTINYTDFSISAGYAYNWVFAKNWLFGSSLSLGLGYKTSQGATNVEEQVKNKFSFNNFNLDGITRLGLVWNNMKYYVGASAIFHGYNYDKEQFSINNIFGNLNIYVGFNFNRKKEYK